MMFSFDLKRNVIFLFYLFQWIVNYGLFICISYFKFNFFLRCWNLDYLSVMILIIRGYVREIIVFISINVFIVIRIILL